MNQEPLSDIEKEILFLIENPEHLDHISYSDLTLFKEALKLIKEQVIQQIISEALTMDSSLLEPIATTQKILNSRITKLQQKKASMSQSATQKKIQSSSNFPLDDQIALLQAHIQSLESLSNSLDNPQEFIKIFCAEKVCTTPNSEEYNSLVKDCALSMALLNSSPGKNFSGLTDKEKTENGPLFNTKPSIPHGFPIYTLNPVSLATFFERISNPKLINELDAYYTQISQIYSLESTFEYENSKLKTAQNKLIAIDNPAIYQDLEKYLTSIHQAINDYHSATKIWDETHPKTHKTKISNLLGKFFNNFWGKRKKEHKSSNPLVKFFRKFIRTKKDQNPPVTTTVSNTSESELQNTISSSLQDIQQLQLQHEERIKTDSTYALAYKTYFESAILPTYLKKTPNIDLIHKNDKFYVLNQVHFSKPESKRNFAVLLEIYSHEGSEFRNSILNRLHQTISDQQPVVDSLSQQLSQQDSQSLPYSELTKTKLYSNLSPEAKYLVDANIDISELKSKYIEFTAQQNYIYSPFAASLVVKALLKAFDIRTAKEAEELGLTFTQDEAIQRQHTLISSIDTFKSHLKTLSTYGQKLESR